MKLNYKDGLLFSSISFRHQSIDFVLDDVIIDTGASESLISIDAVHTFFQSYEPDDQIRFMTGIGGREAAVRRKINQIKFGPFVVDDIFLDFGRIGDYPGINGLIGLDLLIPGKFIIDLNRFEIYQI